MKRLISVFTLLLLCVFCHGKSVDEAKKLYDDCNYAESFAMCEEMLNGNDKLSPEDVCSLLEIALQNSYQLNNFDKYDALFEKIAASYKKDVPVIVCLARSIYQSLPHTGYMVDGKFIRNSNRYHWRRRRGQGEILFIKSRDRAWALRLLDSVMDNVSKDTLDENTKNSYWRLLCDIILSDKRKWELQILTDFASVPDFDENEFFYGPDYPPLDAYGQPVFYAMPKSFETAASDGERLRWCLARYAETGEAGHYGAINFWVNLFLIQQFSVSTSHSMYGMDMEKLKAMLKFTELNDNETYAKFANGIHKITLPDDYCFLRILKDYAAECKNSIYVTSAINSIVSEYIARQQFDKALEWIDRIPDKKERDRRHKEIAGNWISIIEGTGSMPSKGKNASFQLRYRNAQNVHFSAKRIKLDAYTKRVLDDWEKGGEWYRNPSDDKFVFHSFNMLDNMPSWQDKDEFVGVEVAAWDLKLDPKPNYQDSVAFVETPLDEDGVYLVECKAENGNTVMTMVFVHSLRIVHKEIVGCGAFQVLDNLSGSPVPNADVTLWSECVIFSEKNKRERHVRRLQYKTDADGFVFLKDKDVVFDNNNGFYVWNCLVSAPGRGVAWFEYGSIDRRTMFESYSMGTRYYSVTDRPVYRPGDTVNVKLWVVDTNYDNEKRTRYAGQKINLKITDQFGTEVHAETGVIDDFGGVEFKWTSDASSKLGAYFIIIESSYQQVNGFRIEEYKKPEYEIKLDVPEKTFKLGDKIPVTINVDYYFGGPVTDAELEINVKRSGFNSIIWPVYRWDWLYGSAEYWWFYDNYYWHPAWRKCGCIKPGFFGGFRDGGQEVVLTTKGTVGENGTYEFVIDTEPAKLMLGDRDHRYEISVTARDKSRRTISSTKSVVVPCKPFNLCVYGEHGFYKTGENAEFKCQAKTADGKPVKGKGKVSVFQIFRNDAGDISEKTLSQENADTDVNGMASYMFVPEKQGQYRIEWTVEDVSGQTADGTCIFNVLGAASELHKYNGLELIPQLKEYAPGQALELMVNTDQPDSTVMLFVRPSHGICPRPQIIRMKGQSEIIIIPIVESDQPNFYVEAYTLYDGILHTAMRNIAVPPADKILNVQIESVDELKPGATNTVKIHVTDMNGKPVHGRLALAAYDRSIDYFAGNAKRPFHEIWNWRRYHHMNTAINSHMSMGFFPSEKDYMPIFSSLALVMNAGGMGAMDQEENAVFDMAGVDRKSMPAPAPAAAPRMMAKQKSMANSAMAADDVAANTEEEADSGDNSGNAKQMRSDFADTAFWNGAVDTDELGNAEVSFKMPDSLTSWKICAWCSDKNAAVGSGEALSRTAKNLMVRLEAPRFFVEKDTLVLSAIVNSKLADTAKVKVTLECDGDCLKITDKATRTVKVQPNGDVRVDWNVKVEKEGTVMVRVKASSDNEFDGMEKSFPVMVHGMDKTVTLSAMLSGNQNELSMEINVPKKIRDGKARLDVNLSPSLAFAMTDALPYLLEYPYGCTEQTLNRFLPAVITRTVIDKLGIDLADIEKKLASNPTAKDGARKLPGYANYVESPVFDKKEMERIVSKGMNDLLAMQCSDGGWGWFSGYGERSWPHTTAQVVHGLHLAQECNVLKDNNALNRGVNWLINYQNEQLELLKNGRDEKKIKEPGMRYKLSADNMDAFVYMVLAENQKNNKKMGNFIFEDKKALSIYAKALFGLGLQLNSDSRAAELLRNIRQFQHVDMENQTSWLELGNGGYWWYWYGDEIEAHAAFLKLLVRLEPDNDTAALIVKYLLNNRKHAVYWRSTRDTAACIEAFAEYLAVSGENMPDMTVNVSVDGKHSETFKMDASTMLTGKFSLNLDDLRPGKHVISVKREGKGPVYVDGRVTYFSLEDKITKAGLELKATRNVYKLVRNDKIVDSSTSTGAVVGRKVEKYKRIPLKDGDAVKSGEMLEIELVLESKNDYEYILVEDFHAAGMECVNVNSGYTGNSLGAYMEFRDNRTALMIRSLPRGRSVVSYKMYAEIPGYFSALPTVISGMYATDLVGNSDEFKIKIKD